MKKIGILGGSFDPFHLGHLSMAKKAIDALNLECVYITPAYMPPHKQSSIKASYEDREKMIELTIKNELKIFLSDLDQKEEEFNYTLYLLERFKKLFPKDELNFIIGGDSLKTFETWFKPTKIMSLSNIIVFPRDEMGEIEAKNLISEYESKYHGRFYLINQKILPISSTSIRELIKNKGDLHNLIHKEVEKYIYDRRLYES